MPRMAFSPAKDLVPAALVAELPTVMVVRADLPWKTLAKAKPGHVTQALAGLAATAVVRH